MRWTKRVGTAKDRPSRAQLFETLGKQAAAPTKKRQRRRGKLRAIVAHGMTRGDSKKTSNAEPKRGPKSPSFVCAAGVIVRGRERC